MNIVELELDETLADFEIQDWIDNVFSVQYPEIKAKIKHGCSGLCHKHKDEWHYPSKGEMPENNARVLLLTEDNDLFEAIYFENEGFKHPVFSQWYYFDNDTNQHVAWIEKEKILPKGE